MHCKRQDEAVASECSMRPIIGEKSREKRILN